MNLSVEQTAAARAGIRGPSQVVAIYGFAGTGKSVVSREIIEAVPNIIICSNDGIAAQNIGGTTICSAFGVPTQFQVDPKFKDTRGQRKKDTSAVHWNRTKKGLPNSDIHRFEPIKAAPIREGTHLLIDEAFRMSCWVTDFIDKECRKARRCPEVPFGGLVVIFVGDDGQGQPILTDEDKKELDEWGYSAPYDFRSAHCLKDVKIEEHHLSKVFRQTEGYDSMVLSRFRTGDETEADLAYVNQRVVDKQPFGSTAITAMRYRVDKLNDLGLSRLTTDEIRCVAMKKGCFMRTDLWPERRLPFPSVLKLKPGCRIIIKDNNKTKIGKYTQQVWNGEQGVYEGMDRYGRLVIQMDRGDEVFLKKQKKHNGTKVRVIETCINPDKPEDQQVWEKKKRIVDDSANVFEQYPIRLGYAITIAASQGSTIGKVHLDLTDGIKGTGDLYVALSRVAGGFANLSLSRPITKLDNKVSKDIKKAQGEQYGLI